MPERPPIPRELERKVLVEAGHRCAIPTCRQAPVEIAHITPWSKCREHTFANLICLCPTCHARCDRGEIDRQAMLLYKRRLAVLNRRYTDLEVCVMQSFAHRPEEHTIALMSDLGLLLGNLLEDGLLEDTNTFTVPHPSDGLARQVFRITALGLEDIARWLPPDQEGE